jgi:hypothetical protein
MGLASAPSPPAGVGVGEAASGRTVPVAAFPFALTIHAFIRLRERQPLRAASMRDTNLVFLGTPSTKKYTLLTFSQPYSVLWARGLLSPCRLSRQPLGASPVPGGRARGTTPVPSCVKRRGYPLHLVAAMLTYVYRCGTAVPGPPDRVFDDGCVCNQFVHRFIPGW